MNGLMHRELGARTDPTLNLCSRDAVGITVDANQTSKCRSSVTDLHHRHHAVPCPLTVRVTGIYGEWVRVVLRGLEDVELDRLFDWEQDPAAVEMAAFTRADPSDRDAFDAHYERIRGDPSVLLRAIDDGNGLVGTIGSFIMQGEREITYWIDPARWGEGLASAALDVFLTVDATRPLHARVAEHNFGSAKVLARAGFVEVGSETSYADGIRRNVIEHIYRLAQ